MSLRDEHRRLTRLGFTLPLMRCREQQRFWEFLAALFEVPAAQPKPAPVLVRTFGRVRRGGR